MKEHDVYEIDNEENPHRQEEEENLTDLNTNEGLRFQLLVLSKEILMGRAAMKWETHKQYESVSVSEIVGEANRMYSFVKGTPG
tara:strand:- start:1897 stop:2148 length:252 start_codon:yes stop_codon:yes gene_type:complete